MTNVSACGGVPADHALEGLSDLMGQADCGRRPHPSAAGCHSSRPPLHQPLGDSYCSLAWGKARGGDGAGGCGGGHSGVRTKIWTPANRRIAQWSSEPVATDPNAIEARGVQQLRDAGFNEAQIFAITTFVALRLAFSTINGTRWGQVLTLNWVLPTPAPVSVRRHVCSRPPGG